MPETVGDRVVVLGGGLGALLAAKVLVGAYREVILVERDEIVDVVGHRRGVPHGRHAHGLVAKGQQIFERLYPGLTQRMVDGGVKPGDFNGDIRWYFGGRRIRPARSGLISVPATRPVLEFHLRNMVQQMPSVQFLQNHDVLGIETTVDGRRVIGARVQRRQQGSEPTVVPADLVIDMTGRGSRTPVWLAELGYGRPAEDSVEIDLAYTTRHYRVDADPFGPDLALIPAATPSHPRGAFFYRLPGDDNRVELSLTGVLGDHPPTEPDGFLEYVRSLPVADIYHTVRDAEPLDDPVKFRFPASVRRRYERLTRFPDNFLVMGDAICSFNPVYAQGMTVAALETVALGEHLARGRVPDWRRFFSDIAKRIDSPWDFTANADLGYAAVPGRRTVRTRVINSYVAKLQRAAAHDAGLGNAFVRVAGLVDPPTSLLTPDKVVRVLRKSTWPAPEPAASSAVRAQADHISGGQ